eukprot:Gb_10683 [translate_table: standard]
MIVVTNPVSSQQMKKPADCDARHVSGRIDEFCNAHYECPNNISYEGPDKLADDTHCISCKDEAPMFPGVSDGGVCSGECVLSDQRYVQCSLDAKARPGFIFGILAMRNEGFGGFVSTIVNHGSYRNLPHMHLKIWVDDGMHKRARVRWTERRRQLWARLELLTSRLPKKRALCVV